MFIGGLPLRQPASLRHNGLWANGYRDNRERRRDLLGSNPNRHSVESWVQGWRAHDALSFKAIGRKRCKGGLIMSRDLVPDDRSGSNELSSVNQKYAGTALEPRPIVREFAEDEAQLIMSRLVREYLERRPAGS
jgi:hypothetical protein